MVFRLFSGPALGGFGLLEHLLVLLEEAGEMRCCLMSVAGHRRFVATHPVLLADPFLVIFLEGTGDLPGLVRRQAEADTDIPCEGYARREHHEMPHVTADNNHPGA